MAPDAATFHGCRLTDVLILDDEVLIAYDLTETVRGLGYEPVGPACSLNEAYLILEEKCPNLALLDIDIGGETVWPVARKLKEMGCGICFVSANTTHDELITEFPLAQVVDKPANVADIAHTLATLETQDAASATPRVVPA